MWRGSNSDAKNTGRNDNVFSVAHKKQVFKLRGYCSCQFSLKNIRCSTKFQFLNNMFAAGFILGIAR